MRSVEQPWILRGAEVSVDRWHDLTSEVVEILLLGRDRQDGDAERGDQRTERRVLAEEAPASFIKGLPEEFSLARPGRQSGEGYEEEPPELIRDVDWPEGFLQFSPSLQRPDGPSCPCLPGCRLPRHQLASAASEQSGEPPVARAEEELLVIA